MLNNMGIGVKVKMPKEMKAAAKALPEVAQQFGRASAVAEALNTTVQVAIVAASIAGVVVLLSWLKGRGRKES